jgi:ABC-type spermidine/putrescine transport system permease subunit I
VKRLGTLALLTPAAVLLFIIFILPLLRLFALSFTDTGGPFSTYAQLLGDEVYLKVFFNTVFIAVVTTTISIVVSYPVAMVLARLSAGWRALLFGCILLPLWISVLVRTFSWLLLLERSGPINRLLIASGLTSSPFEILFTQTAVIIGMVHVLMPYAILPIYAALIRIDPALLRASDGLGATWLTTFRRVLLPLSARGVMTAATFVFLLSFGFFVTPAVLGGARSTNLSMLIDNFVNEQLIWPMAAAASMILLGACLVMLAAVSRIIPVRAMVETR